MVKWHRLLYGLFIFFLILSVFPVTIDAMDGKQRIFDNADVLTDKEITYLEQVAQKYSDKQETDFIVLTTDEGEKDIDDYMGDFYDDEGLGYDKKHGNAAIITIDMVKRDVSLNGFGKAEQKLSNEKLSTIKEKITSSLSDGDYETAFEDFITLSARYMKFRDSANPANPFYNPWVQIIVAIVIGIVIVYMLARNPGMKKTVNANTYIDNNQSRVNSKRDQFIRTSVTKRRKPKKNSGGGGGRSGGGGGVTGGGRSFSGSRGKF